MKVSPRMYGQLPVVPMPERHSPRELRVSGRIKLAGSVQSVTPPTWMPKAGALALHETTHWPSPSKAAGGWKALLIASATAETKNRLVDRYKGRKKWGESLPYGMRFSVVPLSTM